MTYRKWLNVIKWIDAQCHYIHAQEEMEESATWLASGDIEAYEALTDALNSFDSACYPPFIQRAYAYAEAAQNSKTNK